MKAGFCWNSKRWIVFAIMDNIKTCVIPPFGSNCNQCGYFEERETTKHFDKKYRIIMSYQKEQP